MLKSHNTARYAHIDAMRALAVMLVVVAHAGMQRIIPGGSGVTIFFGISGFIITYLVLKERGRTGSFDIKAFYTRRVLKIMPPLIAVVIIPTISIALFQPIQWKPLLGIVFFYYNWLKMHGVSAQLSGSDVVWSLSIEEQFYLVFALIWLIALRLDIRTKWIAVGVLFTAIFSLGMRIVLVSSSSSGSIPEDRIYFGSDTRIEAIAFGVLTAIGFYYYSVNRPGKDGYLRVVARICQTDSALIFAIGIFLASLVLRNEWFRYTFRFSIQALAACIVIIYGFGSSGTAIKRAFDSIAQLKPIQFTGLASYSIYLAHLLVMSLAGPFVGHFGLTLRIPILIALGTLSGFVVYLAIERPIQIWRNRTKTPQLDQ